MISKPFKTLDNQIDILISRGLVVSDKEVTKSILLRENYYNVINGYKDIFLSYRVHIVKAFNLLNV